MSGLSRLMRALVVATSLAGCANGETADEAPPGGFDSLADGETGTGPSACATCGAPHADDCDDALPLGLAGDLVRGFTGTVVGTTDDATDRRAQSCGGGSGADVVYRIDPPSSGRATVRIAAAFPAVLAVRSACAEAGSERACEVADANGGAELTFPVFGGKPAFVVVDGYAATHGAFSLQVSIAPAICGDGSAAMPEACDDGNVEDGDGCSASCALEASPTTCGAAAFRLAPTTETAAKVSFAGDTTAATNEAVPVACGVTGSGPDVTYALRAGASGNLALTLVADFPDAVLHVRRACHDVSSQVDCAVTSSASAATTDLAIAAEETVYVAVDGAMSARRGLYRLDATLTAARCGNGKLDPGEECDEGGATPGCDASCLVPRDVASYACPGAPIELAGPARARRVLGSTAPAVGSPAAPANNWAWCGSDAADAVYAVTSDVDGLLTTTVKGTFDTALTIRATCTSGAGDLVCARAAVGLASETARAPIVAGVPLFVVVDGASSGQAGSFALDLSVTEAVCGNGVLEGGESCDDRATEDGDGCSATCALESEKARDTCEGAPLVTLEPSPDGRPRALVRSGTTNLSRPPGVTHTLAPCASPGPDAWFRIEAPSAGVLTARIATATFGSVVALRRGCAASTQVTCDATAGQGGQQTSAAVAAGEVIYVGVSGVATNGAAVAGRFELALDLAPTTCGDGFTTGGEACDDGNVSAGDGCSPSCAIEPLAGAAACPGHDVPLAGIGSAVRRAVVTVDTTTLPSETGGACGGSGPEAVLRVVPDVDGVLEARATAGFAVLLHARAACGDPATELLRTSCWGLTTFTRSVKKGVPLFLYVDGANGTSGVAQLRLSVTP